MRGGADEFLTIPYDEANADPCSIRAAERWIEVGDLAGWDMGKGYVFSTISTVRESCTLVRGSHPLSASHNYSAFEAERKGGRRARGIFNALF